MSLTLWLIILAGSSVIISISALYYANKCIKAMEMTLDALVELKLIEVSYVNEEDE